MTSLKEQYERLAAECHRLKDIEVRRSCDPLLTAEERLDAAERARVYAEVASHHMEQVARCEQVRPTAFTGKNTGTQKKTDRRAAFLRTLAADFGTTNREALARHAVMDHRREVRALWDGAEGARAEGKILTFLRNHAHLVFES